MMNNSELFDYSLSKPEDWVDVAYAKPGGLVLAVHPDRPTKLMEAHDQLIRSIKDFSIGWEVKDEQLQDKAVAEIHQLMGKKDINYTEFVSFWPVVDMTYSIFRKLDTKAQLSVLKIILEQYVLTRHNIYETFDYSHSTLQVGVDAKAHKKSGVLGVKKVAQMLTMAGYYSANGETVQQFMESDTKKFIETDKKGKALFSELLKVEGIAFIWQKKYNNKFPDLLFRNGRDLFIVEHKHMKEGGGGQDKQVEEVISFIGYTEKNPRVHYVSFLDGTYFNLFTKSYTKPTKVFTQLGNIREYLSTNPRNYFVNTEGFRRLLEGIVLS